MSVLITKVEDAWKGSATHAYGFLWHSEMNPMEEGLPVYRTDYLAQAKDFQREQMPVKVSSRISAVSGKPYLSGLEKA